MIHVSGAVEGPTDEVVFNRIVSVAGGVVHRVQVQHGKAGLKRGLPGYNAAARRDPWLVLVDLDNDFRCPSDLVADWLPAPSQFMRFRVVVRQVEAWLLADAERFAQCFAVRRTAVPADPDQLANAKETLLKVVATSRRQAIRDDMCPRPGSGRAVGPAYTGRLIEFVTDPQRGWRADVAARQSRSLAKCLVRLKELIAHPPY